MTAATALITGPEASPQLAEEAIRLALERAGLERANGVLLFLSRDFGKKTAATLRAAASAAGCLQIGGITAQGMFTEEGWALDRPAAAALVMGGALALRPGQAPQETLISFADEIPLPGGWLHAQPRFGLLHSGGQAWTQARLAPDNRCDMTIAGASLQFTVSSGLLPLGAPHPVEAMRGLDLLQIGGESAMASLRQSLPLPLREQPRLPLQHLAALRDGDPQRPALAILAANPNESLTLSEAVTPGQHLAWGLRNANAAAAETRQRLAELKFAQAPSFGLMFSCIGRGPVFFGGDDLDLVAWRERFPKTPLLGAYGTGQITPHHSVSRLWQNALVTAVFRENRIDQDQDVFA